MLHRIDRAVVLVVAALAAGRGASAQKPDTLRLSLADAVTRAVRFGDEVRLADAQIEVTGAQLAQARASGLPQLRMAGSFGHIYENARAQAVGQIFNQPNTFNANVNLSQTVFQGGRIVAGYRAA